MEPFGLSDPPLRRYKTTVWDSARWNWFARRADDVLICTPYKSGTTWMQMICALLIFRTPDLPLPLAEISPWMDLRAAPADQVHAVYGAQTHRRFIKTHTPLDGLPWDGRAKHICVLRDPRVVFISMSNQMKNNNPEADALFMAEMDPDAPKPPEEPNALFRYWLSTASFAWERDGAPYWSALRHGATFWQHRAQDGILMVHYADMKADLAGQMRRVAAYLGIHIEEALWADLVHAAGFAQMKARADKTAPDTNFNMWKDNSAFFNKGVSRQWEGVLTDESLVLLDEALERYPSDYVRWLLRP